MIKGSELKRWPQKKELIKLLLKLDNVIKADKRKCKQIQGRRTMKEEIKQMIDKLDSVEDRKVLLIILGILNKLFVKRGQRDYERYF